MIRYIGELNKRIYIQRRAAEQDEYGMPLPELWITVFERWANKADLTGREYFAAAAEQMLANTTFTIRYTKGISNDMRILCNGEVYNIIFISEMRGMGDFMELKAQKKEPEEGV